MKYRYEYRERLTEFKRLLLKAIPNKKTRNYILLKIRKLDYKPIYEYFDIGHKLFPVVMLLAMADKRTMKQERFKKKMEFLNKRKYFLKVADLANNENTDKILDSLKKTDYKTIKFYEENYDLLMGVFEDIDKFTTKETFDKLLADDYMDKSYLLDNMMGLGLFIRNRFIHSNTNKINDKLFTGDNIFMHDDSKSMIIMLGYRLYKMGGFDIFLG